MPLTFEDISGAGLIEVVAELFDDETKIGALLTSAGISSSLVSALGSTAPLNYWIDVCQELARGRVVNGLENLLAAAAANYPGNVKLRAYLRRDPTEQVSRPTVVPMVVRVPETMSAKKIAELVEELQRRNILIELVLNFGQTGSSDLFFTLDNVTPEQAEFARQLVAKVTRELGHQDATVELEDHHFRDYYLDGVRIEGPDQSTFELEQLRASTTVGQLAKGVIEEAYSTEFFPPEKAGPRRAVIDHVQDDGTSKRLNPNDTLHDAGVRPHAHLRIHQDARAGAVNPIRRYESLVAAKHQILRYREAHPEFEVEANDQSTPTEYLFRFAAPSFAPGNPPVPINEHEVFLLMPPDFPVHAPLAFWQHPIFHPNIHAENGAVCLGALQASYTPGLDFALVCDMLRDMAAYRNYVVHEGFNPEAARWVVTPQGQQAIVAMGGRSLEQVYREEGQAHPPRHFKIRRTDS